MTTREILTQIRDIMAQHTGDQRDLYETLLGEAEGWKMWLEETQDEESAPLPATTPRSGYDLVTSRPGSVPETNKFEAPEELLPGSIENTHPNLAARIKAKARKPRKKAAVKGDAP